MMSGFSILSRCFLCQACGTTTAKQRQRRRGACGLTKQQKLCTVYPLLTWPVLRLSSGVANGAPVAFVHPRNVHAGRDRREPTVPHRGDIYRRFEWLESMD